MPAEFTAARRVSRPDLVDDHKALRETQDATGPAGAPQVHQAGAEAVAFDGAYARYPRQPEEASGLPHRPPAIDGEDVVVDG